MFRKGRELLAPSIDVEPCSEREPVIGRDDELGGERDMTVAWKGARKAGRGRRFQLVVVCLLAATLYLYLTYLDKMIGLRNA